MEYFLTGREVFEKIPSVGEVGVACVCIDVFWKYPIYLDPKISNV